MIRVEVEEYCQMCFDFVPDVTEPEKIVKYCGNEDPIVMQTDTIIRCENRRRCEGIKRYIERQSKEEVCG